jgi:hypothetical protein
MVEVSRSEGGQEDDLLSQSPAKCRPHRPHCHECKDFQGFRAVGSIMGYRLPVTITDRTREDRPLINLLKLQRFAGLLSSIYFLWSVRSVR